MPTEVPEIIDARAATVSVGDAFASLTENENLHCDSLTLAIAPKMSQATLSYYYGKMAKNAAVFRNYDPIDLKRKYVKIEIPNLANSSDETVFHGVVGPQEESPAGTFEDNSGDVPSGTNRYTVYSLDYLLTKIYPDKSYYTQDGTTEENVKTMFAFNGRGALLEKNRTSTKIDADAHSFDLTGEGENWTALDVVEYLLARFADGTGLTWSLDGDYSYLQHITVSLDPRGRSLRECLNELITPNRGFSYKIKVESDNPVLDVFSVAQTAIEVGGTTLVPANSSQVQLGSAIELSRRVKNVRIQQVEASAYNKIRVYS